MSEQEIRTLDSNDRASPYSGERSTKGISYPAASVPFRESDNHELAKHASKAEDPPNQQATITNLPNDLLVSIFSTCDARTIGILRQCCKEFNELSGNQIVWLEVLKASCAELNFPVPSFQESERSGSNIELLATAWIRFQMVLRNTQDGETPPHKIMRSIKIPQPLLNLDQTPDGRFLFATTIAGLRVWNIQTHLPSLVGSFDIEIPEDSWNSMSVDIESDDSFLAILSFNAGAQGSSEMLAFRFDIPTREDAENRLHLISRLSRLPFPAQQWYSWSTIPTVPFLITSFKHVSEGKHYVVWDSVSGTCASWAADINDTSVNPTIFIIRDFIIAFDKPSHAMVVYARPEIPPKDSYEPEYYAKLNNPALLHVPAESDMINRQKVSTIYWKTFPRREHLVTNFDGFASIYNMEDDNWLLERVEISRADSSSSTFTPLPLKCEQSRSQFHHYLPIRAGSIGTADVFIDQSLLLHGLSRDGTRAVFHLSSTSKNSGGVELGRGFLYDSGGEFEFGRLGYSLCPFAGRMCIETPGGIEIIDFVEMPYLQDIPADQRGHISLQSQMN